MLHTVKPAAVAASRSSHPLKARALGPLPVAAFLIAAALLVVYHASGRHGAMTTSQVRRREGGSRAGRTTWGGSGSCLHRNRS
jgi:hypothetical protein